MVALHPRLPQLLRLGPTDCQLHTTTQLRRHSFFPVPAERHDRIKVHDVCAQSRSHRPPQTR